jgi:hypothetical protein
VTAFLKRAAFVRILLQKVEYRETSEISRKFMVVLLCETMWSLTPPREKRISGAKKLVRQPKAAFFNTCQQPALHTWLGGHEAANRSNPTHRGY